MTNYRKSSHTVYLVHYHFVFSTKYRKPALVGPIGVKVRDLIREICKTLEVDILKGHVRRHAQSTPGAARQRRRDDSPR